MKILMIGAHQDDNEFRAGGVAKKFIDAGYEVRFLSVSNGSGGHHIMTPEETVIRRANESAKVAEFLGITYDIWEIEDCNIVADLSTRKRLIRYIRNYCPDLIITHRINDYHPDHRATALLVQDASFLLTVPHECPDAPAMRFMPVIMFNEDRFSTPEFRGDVVVDIDNEIDVKFKMADINESQVYEWLPYTSGEENDVPKDKKARFEWLKGMNITSDMTDEEVMAQPRGYAVRFAKPAARFRKELIQRYGIEKGSKVRYAEAFEISEYGAQPSPEMLKKLFPF